MRHPLAVGATELARELRARVAGEVRFDEGSRALYATDASNYRQVPIGVVLPRSIEDVTETLSVCRRFGAPVLARGGGTSLAGQCCNVAVVIDTSKHLHRVLAVDPATKRARVEPGAVLDDLRREAERHHLTFGPDPATHRHCTMGGMIGNNSCGVHSVMAGRTEDNVLELDVVTYDGLRLRVGRTAPEELARIVHAGGRRGEIYGGLHALAAKYAGLIRARYPDIPRRVSGYNLPALLPENGFDVARALVGTECTCAFVLEATVRLVDSPPARALAVVGYPDIFGAADDVPFVLESAPIALEAFEENLLAELRRTGVHPEELRLMPSGGGWLIVEFGGADRREARDKARALAARVQGRPAPPSVALYDDPAMEAFIWRLREWGLAAAARAPGRKTRWEGWEDSAVAPHRLGPYLRDLRALLDRYAYQGDFYGHFGQGCVHMRIDFDLASTPGLGAFRAFMREAAELVVGYGGSLSGEHGDGQARAELLPVMFGPELVQAFREFKAIWDPQGRMNPGKIVDPYRMDENLRLGPSYRPRQPETRFRFPADGGSLARATERCVGVGECRRLEGGTMCPSFMVTREEKHSTRGRARLLFEMLSGEGLGGGWRDEHVKEALDLCLACKGCRGDCPARVDVATYKAEFLSHYYQGRLRPRSAYAMGLVHWWTRAGALAPGLVNALTQNEPWAGLLKAAGGIAPQRRLPCLARRTFRSWFLARSGRRRDGPRVVLWADTFNDRFHPQTARAAVAVLEAAGWQVDVPSRVLCCGRPLYDTGMLDLARSMLRGVLVAMRADITAGTPVVVLEPSCLSVFRDEALNLLAGDPDAERFARQCASLGEFLHREGRGAPLPTLRRRTLVHGHCHQKALADLTGETAVLARMGAECEVLDAGCCGMAGAFGFEKDKYEVSMKVGERVLLPAVRGAGKDVLVMADGFSCREQIAQATDRRALHLADVLALALRHGPDGPDGPYPERSSLAGAGA
ncbi:MAG TPA: FAD-linked oxidase C-terminal domain-containing protein [Vicinamibacteria bacterium]|nr:FAD-linked oxidase C-terminal domain-containing protein [Vicinamibacteria bacterium]